MGMYDSVLVRYKLDEPVHNTIWYQTKCLDCSLSRYIVDEAGYLWIENVQYRQREGGLFGFQLEAIGSTVEQVPHHGDIEIYGHKDRDDPGILYMLRFIDGKLARTAQCKTRREDGWAVWESNPFPPIDPRPTALVAPVFPDHGQI